MTPTMARDVPPDPTAPKENLELTAWKLSQADELSTDSRAA